LTEVNPTGDLSQHLQEKGLTLEPLSGGGRGGQTGQRGSEGAESVNQGNGEKASTNFTKEGEQ